MPRGRELLFLDRPREEETALNYISGAQLYPEVWYRTAVAARANAGISMSIE